MTEEHISTVTLKRILEIRENNPWDNSSIKDLVSRRLVHCADLHKSMLQQAKDTELNEYKRQAALIGAKAAFYKHLLGSKSELVAQSYFINNEWMVI